MSENEDVGIELGVDADAALETFQQLTAAALKADDAIQQLKQHQVDLSNAIPGNPPVSSYNEAASRFQQMDPALIRDTYPEIAQTQNAINARRTEVRSQAMDFVGANPQVVTQPLPDTLSQFQQSMVQREQQQAQQQWQAQQQAAGVDHPARYGYDTTPQPLQRQATPTATVSPLPVDTSDQTGATVQPVAPLATSGDDRLTQALTAASPVAPSVAPVVTPTGDAAAAGADVVGPLPQTFEELAAAARAADTNLQDLKQHLLDAFNAIPRGSQPEAASYSEAATRLGTMDPSIVQELHPDIARTQGAINARRDELAGQVSHFAADNPEAAAEPLPAQQDMLTRWQDLLRQHNEQQQATAAATVGQGGGDGQDGDSSLPNAGGATYYRQSVRSGPFVPPGMERLARYGYDAAQQMDAHDARQRSGLPGLNGGSTGGNGGGNSNDTTQQDRSATVLGDHIAQALTRSAGGLMAGGISGAANAAGMGATGDLVSGLVRPLMGLIGEAAPLALGAIGAIGGVAGVGLGVNSLQSKYAGEERQLAGSVGTSTGATPEGELTTAQQTGWRYYYHEQQSVAAAQQLGDVGVTSDQMGGALTQSMALARLSGVDLSQTTSLTGQMMQGGMSSNQVGQAYAEMDQVSRLLPVSLGRITDGIKAMNAAAGVGQISLNGLAATQALSDASGAKINIGQAMAGTIGSTGTNALAQGAILGLDPTAFSNAQRDPAKLWDAYANTARRYDIGSGGTRIAQQALSEGGFDFSQFKGNQADTFIQKLVSEGPNAAQKYEQSLQQKENAPHAAGPHTADQFAAAGKAFADQVTPIGKQLEIAGEKAANALVRGAQDAAHALTPLEVRNQQQQQHDRRYGPSGVGTSHTTNVNPMQQLTQSTQGRGGLPPLPGSYMIPNGQGNSNRVLPYQMSWYEDAAKKYAPPGMDPNAFLSEMLAQGSAESGFNPNAVSRDKNGNPIAEGIAQFTPATAHAMGLKDPFNAQQSIAAQARLDAALYQTHGHNEKQALAAYNGSGTQAQAYGENVYSAAQQTQRLVSGIITHTTSVPGDTAQAHDQQGGWTGSGSTSPAQHHLAITVTVQDPNGHHMGQAHVSHTVNGQTSHSVDPTRRHVASQSYGPQDRTPPAPGLPNLPGHVYGPIRR